MTPSLSSLLGNIPIGGTGGVDFTNPTLGPQPNGRYRINRDLGGQAGGGVLNRGAYMTPNQSPPYYETQGMGGGNPLLGGMQNMPQQQGYNLDEFLKGVQTPPPTSGMGGGNPYGGGNAFGGGFGNIVQQLMQKYYGGGV